MNKILFCTSFLLASAVFAADPAFVPLWQYQGTWEFTMNTPGSKPATNKIQNDCAEIGQFFLCQQTVDGHAAGLGELEIEGDCWTYPSKEEASGKTKYYRIVNLFAGKDRIHFERSEFVGGKTWTVLSSGDEVRKSQAGTRPDPRR